QMGGWLHGLSPPSIPLHLAGAKRTQRQDGRFFWRTLSNRHRRETNPMVTLVANSRQPPIGRNVGKMGHAGYGKPRLQTPQPNSPPVAMIGGGFPRTTPSGPPVAPPDRRWRGSRLDHLAVGGAVRSGGAVKAAAGGHHLGGDLLGDLGIVAEVLLGVLA